MENNLHRNSMTTMTHQWLATAFIPRKVINKVLKIEQYKTMK